MIFVCSSFDPVTGPQSRRRSSVVVIPPSMQICPGDLLVPAAYNRTLTRGYTLSGVPGGPMCPLPAHLGTRFLQELYSQSAVTCYL